MLIVSKLLGVFVLPWLSRSFEEWLVSVQGTAGAEPDQYAIWPHNVAPPLWHNLLSIAPHSASTFQTMLGLGGCLSGSRNGMSRAAEDFCSAKAVRGSRTCSVDDVCGSVCCHMGS